MRLISSILHFYRNFTRELTANHSGLSRSWRDIVISLIDPISCIAPELFGSAAAYEMRVPACPLGTSVIC
jgi:hypothetical protein